MQITEDQITAAARALSNDNADICNVNREDNWMLYGDSFRETAKIALEAAFAQAVPVPQDSDERARYDGDNRESRAAFRNYDTVAEPVSQKTPWQIWRDACAWQAALASNKAAAVAVGPTDDVLWDQALTERDNYHEWADKLANAIAEHFGIEIGEHSSANNPWSVALDTLENMVAPIAQAWRTTEPSVCVPMTEDPGVAALWREAGFDVIDLFESMPVAAAVAVGEPKQPCMHVDNPKGCYRVRCQLGNKCADDEMSIRAKAAPAPIESPDGKINEPHHIRRPVAYVAPFDLDVLAPGHQESVKARLTRFPTRTRTVALYTTGHPAAAQPSRAEVLEDLAKKPNLIGQAVYSGKTGEAYRMLDELREAIRALKENP
jgi:hypothetical protein